MSLEITEDCPFCHWGKFTTEATPEVNSCIESDGDDAGFAIVCPNCYCAGPLEPTPQLAIDAWNDRGVS
jgi:hypothetical protein